MRTRSVPRMVKAAAAILLVVPFAVLSSGGPAAAAAEGSCWYNNLAMWHGNDFAMTFNNCYRLDVYDGEADGHGVRAEFYTSQDYTMRTVRDSNGSKDGAGVWSDGVHYVTNFRVCESTKGCSDWLL
jgi:hypothetical protein